MVSLVDDDERSNFRVPSRTDDALPGYARWLSLYRDGGAFVLVSVHNRDGLPLDLRLVPLTFGSSFLNAGMLICLANETDKKDVGKNAVIACR